MPIKKVRQLKASKTLQDKVNQSQLQINRARDIPSIPLFPTEYRTFAFIFTSAMDNYSFSPRDLCRMIAVAQPGSGGSTIYPAFARVMVRKIEMWGGVAPAPGVPAPVCTCWLARTLTDGGPVKPLGSMMQDAQPLSGDIPAHIVVSDKAKANSLIRNVWFEQDDADYLFTGTAGMGTVMHITVNFTWNLWVPTGANSLNSVSYTDITGKPALGLSALDSGNASGSRIIVPLGVGNSSQTQVPIFD
jgi:hypothetical protein